MRLTRIALLAIALIIGLGFHRLVHLLLQDVAAQTFQATEEMMVDTAHLLASLPLDHDDLRKGLDEAARRELKASIYELEKAQVGLGVYLTDSEGIVVFDSEGGRREGEDYSEYNDVYLCLRGEYGRRSTRTDPEDPSSSIMHVAAPLLDETGAIVGALTVFKAKADVFAFVQGRRRSILLTAGLIGTGLVALMAATFWWLFRPMGRLTDYAQEIARGGRPALPKLGFGREANTLGRALAEMRESLEGRQYAERYVRNLTHELKSPIAAIKGAAELLNEEMSLEDRARFLGNIRSECDRSERVIQRLLLLSELEGRTHLGQVEPIELRSVVDRVLEECQPAAELREVRLRAKGEAEVEGDRLMLRTAIENLVENAIDFSPSGGCVTVEIVRESDRLGIVVSDEGSGFPDYALERAFERFYSLGRPDTGKKGSGLGLSLVRETAELHGGRAEAQNRAEGGAEVSIWLSP